MEFRWNIKPIMNAIVDILVKNKGEILDKRLEELLKKEFSITSIQLEEIFLKMEAMNIINVFRVSNTKKMIVLKKNTPSLSEEVLEDIT
ncbi:MAG: hypothetical protein ACTSU4_11605 [Promethearchaeota archaeon]